MAAMVGSSARYRERCDLYVEEVNPTLSPRVKAGFTKRLNESAFYEEPSIPSEGCKKLVIHNRDWLTRDNPNAISILRALASNKTLCAPLHVLGVSKANLGRQCVKLVAEIISNCEKIDTVYIGGNSIGDSGAAIIASSLPRSNSIRNVDFTDNDIGEGGALAIAEAMKKCPDLDEIYMEGNMKVGKSGVVALKAAANRGRIRVMFGEGVPMTPAEANELIRTYRRHAVEESCRERSMCMWPSCKLLHFTRLISDESGDECEYLSLQMSASGVKRHSRGGADAFVNFLREDPAGLIALVGRRKRNEVARQEIEALEVRRNKEVTITTLLKADPRQHISKAYGHHVASFSEIPCFSFGNISHDFVLQNMFYFPDPASSGLNGPCPDHESDLLRAHLGRLSARGNCAVKNQLIAAGPPFGFGSLVTSWIKPFMFAVDQNLSFWSPSLGAYRDKKAWAEQFSNGTSRRFSNGTSRRCLEISTTCFFEPLAQCETVQKLDGCKTSNGVGEPLRKCIHEMHANDKETFKYSLLKERVDQNGLPNTVPFAYRHKGHFWYSSELLHWIFKEPNQRLLLALDAAKKGANWAAVQRPLLSVHVRHGDTCSQDQQVRTHRRCEPLSVYMESAILPMAHRYHIKSIFIATDGDEVLDEIRNYPQFSWHFVPGQDRGESKKYFWDHALREGKLDEFKEAQSAIIDLLLLAEADAFVGKFTSNIDRIAFSLMVARKKSMVPYASLDSTWCMDWGVPGGTSVNGNYHC